MPYLVPHKPAVDIKSLQEYLKKELASLSRRLKIVEERLDTLRSHLELIDNNIVEKHKSSLGEIRSIETKVRDLRADVEKNTDLAQRLMKRLEAFASREEVKVLERYVNMWQPLNYVTRAEVETLIQRAIKRGK